MLFLLGSTGFWSRGLSRESLIEVSLDGRGCASLFLFFAWSLLILEEEEVPLIGSLLADLAEGELAD